MKKLIVAVTVPHTGTRSLMNVVDKNGYISLSRLLVRTKEARKNKNRCKIVSSLTEKMHHLVVKESKTGN